MKYRYEILLQDGKLTLEHFQNLFETLRRYHKLFHRFSFAFAFLKSGIHLYLHTNDPLPVFLDGLSFFAFQEKEAIMPYYDKTGSTCYFWNDETMIEVFDKFYYQKKKEIVSFAVQFFNGGKKYFFHQSYVYYKKNNYYYKSRCMFLNPYTFFAFDIAQSNRFVFQKIPTFFKIQKQLCYFGSSQSSSCVEISSFPYLSENCYLSISDYDFFCHSLILGGSGSGKSKFLCTLLKSIYEIQKEHHYKVIVIDPHAALEQDIGGLDATKVIDFMTSMSSVHLFSSNSSDVIQQTELYLSLFSMLMGDLYNSKLERVLRFSFQLLISIHSFSFQNLRKLLMDTDYRMNLLQEYQEEIDCSIADFFFQDFYELKTKSYGEAISPIIAFLDEMQSVPVFATEEVFASIDEVIEGNFLTLFSLSRVMFGDHIIQVIAGFLMCQILSYVQSYEGEEEFLFVIDEVAIVENPILCRFLSEARKYHVAVVLISQYLTQVSSSLKDAILANVVNYYLFRIAYFDADLLVDHMNMSLYGNNIREEKIKMLTGLSNREGVLRIQKEGKILSAMKFKTLPFTSIPRKNEFQKQEKKEKKEKKSSLSFVMDPSMKVGSFLKTISTSHKKVR